MTDAVDVELMEAMDRAELPVQARASIADTGTIVPYLQATLARQGKSLPITAIGGVDYYHLGDFYMQVAKPEQGWLRGVEVQG